MDPDPLVRGTDPVSLRIPSLVGGHPCLSYNVVCCTLKLAAHLSDELAEQAAKSGRGDLHQSKGAARLFKRINSMLNTMDGVVKNLEVRHQGRHLYEAYGTVKRP